MLFLMTITKPAPTCRPMVVSDLLLCDFFENALFLEDLISFLFAFRVVEYTGECSGITGTKLTHQFKIPDKIDVKAGGKYLLQWRYVSNFPCRPEGMNEYPMPAGWEVQGDPNHVCAGGLDPITMLQCAEVTLVG